MTKKKTWDEVADKLAEDFPQEIEELFDRVIEEHCSNCPCGGRCKNDESKSIKETK